MKFKFQVGDIVDWEEKYGQKRYVGEAVVKEVRYRLVGRANYKIQDVDTGETFYARTSELDLIDRPVKESQCNDGSCTPVKAVESRTSVFSNAVQKVRELALPKDERLLRKHNVVDDCGNLTAGGQALLIDVLFTANRAEIVKALESIEADDKKSKK